MTFGYYTVPQCVGVSRWILAGPPLPPVYECVCEYVNANFCCKMI